MTRHVPELAVIDALPAPHGLPTGEFTVTKLLDGALRIDHADPRVLISASLLDSIRDCLSPYVTLDPPAGGCDLTYTGAVLKIHGVNRSVIYRITNWLAGIDACIAEWPD